MRATSTAWAACRAATRPSAADGGKRASPSASSTRRSGSRVGGDLEDDASWAGDDRGASDDDDAVDAFLLGANPDGAPDPDDVDEDGSDGADSWAGDGRDGGSDDDMWGACDDDDGDAASASDPDSDSSDDAWAREWARRLSTDETSPRGAATDAGAEEARLAREMLGDDVVMADSGSDDGSDSSGLDSESRLGQRSSADAPPAAYREPLVTTWDNKRKRRVGATRRARHVRARADSKEESCGARGARPSSLLMPRKAAAAAAESAHLHIHGGRTLRGYTWRRRRRGCHRHQQSLSGTSHGCIHSARSKEAALGSAHAPVGHPLAPFAAERSFDPRLFVGSAGLSTNAPN